MVAKEKLDRPLSQAIKRKKNSCLLLLLCLALLHQLIVFVQTNECSAFLSLLMHQQNKEKIIRYFGPGQS